MEGGVPFQTRPHIKVGRDADRALLMHDVGKGRHCPAFPRADAFVLEPDVPFVVKVRETLIAVEGGFIRSRHLPDYHGNRATFAFLDGQIGAGLAPLKKQFPALEICRAEDRGVRAAHPHLPDIEVAAVSDVVSFFFHGIHPFLEDLGYLSFYHPKTAEAVRGRAFNLSPSSGCSAVPEGCVSGKVTGQEVSGRCELLADEAQAEEPGSHRVFGILVLLRLGACRPHILCHLA